MKKCICGKTLNKDQKYCSRECSAIDRIKVVSIVDSKSAEYFYGILLGGGRIKKNETIEIEIDPGEEPFQDILFKKLESAFNISPSKLKINRSKSKCFRYFIYYNTKALFHLIPNLNSRSYVSRYPQHIIAGYWDICGSIYTLKDNNHVIFIPIKKDYCIDILTASLKTLNIGHTLISGNKERNNLQVIFINQRSANKFLSIIPYINPYRNPDCKITRTSRYRKRGLLHNVILYLLINSKKLDVSTVKNLTGESPQLITNAFASLSKKDIIYLKPRKTSWYII